MCFGNRRSLTLVGPAVNLLFMERDLSSEDCSRDVPAGIMFVCHLKAPPIGANWSGFQSLDRSNS